LEQLNGSYENNHLACAERKYASQERRRNAKRMDAEMHHNKPKEKAKREALTYEIGRTMTWINVAHLYFHLFKMTLKQT